MPQTDSADPRRQRPLPRPRGGALRRQVGHRLRRRGAGAGDRQAAQGARPRAGPLRARARDRRRHRLLHAQPAARRRDRRGRGHRHLARDAATRSALRRASSARRSRPSPARRGRCRSRTTRSTSSSATRVLHHLPDLDAAFREFRRVLRPGGVLAFCGEPSRYGDRISAVPKRGARALAPLWRGADGRLGAAQRKRRRTGGPRRTGSSSVVDVHAFTPAALSAHAARAGFEDVRVAARSWPRRCSAGSTARSRRPPDPGCRCPRGDRCLLDPIACSGGM